MHTDPGIWEAEANVAPFPFALNLVKGKEPEAVPTIAQLHTVCADTQLPAAGDGGGQGGVVVIYSLNSWTSASTFCPSSCIFIFSQHRVLITLYSLINLSIIKTWIILLNLSLVELKLLFSLGYVPSQCFLSYWPVTSINLFRRPETRDHLWLPIPTLGTYIFATDFFIV